MKIVREKVKDDEEDWLKSRVTDLMESELSEPIVSAIEFQNMIFLWGSKLGETSHINFNLVVHDFVYVLMKNLDMAYLTVQLLPVFEKLERYDMIISDPI